MVNNVYGWGSAICNSRIFHRLFTSYRSVSTSSSFPSHDHPRRHVTRLEKQGTGRRGRGGGSVGRVLREQNVRTIVILREATSCRLLSPLYLCRIRFLGKINILQGRNFTARNWGDKCLVTRRGATRFYHPFTFYFS